MLKWWSGIRALHGFTALGDKIFMFGGITADGILNDLDILPIPRDIGWPDKRVYLSEWVHIYDWDTVILEYGVSTNSAV